MTAEEAVRRAFDTLGIFQPNEPMPAEHAATGLALLTSMLLDWSALPGLVPLSLIRLSFTMNGAASYQIGPSKTWNAAVPVRIIGASVTLGGCDRIVRIVDSDYWDRIENKTDTGVTEVIWYQAGDPYGVVFVWPLGGDSLTITYWTEFSPPTQLSDSIDLPGRYDLAIIYSLASLLGAPFERKVAAEILVKAESSLRRLQTANVRRVTSVTDEASMRRRY